MKLKLDGLNPTNTFERRLLQALLEGEAIPITVHVDDAIEKRVAALEAKPLPAPVAAPDDGRMQALEKQVLDLTRTVQLLLQRLEDQSRTTGQVRTVLIELTDKIEDKLRATG